MSIEKGGENMAKTISLDALDAMLAKGQELKSLLESSPEIAAFAEALKETKGPILVLPGERFIRAGEAAKILGVNENTISQYARQGKLTAYYTPGSSHRKYMLSAVLALPQISQGT